MLAIDIESFLPGLAAVGCHKDAAFFVGAERVADRGYVDDVGIGRMNDDSRNVASLAQTHMLPCLAAVVRPVYPIAE